MYRLEAAVAAPSGNYDGAISASSSRFIVGSWSADSARVYTRTGAGHWTQEAHLSGGAGELFGMSVALSGLHAIVGAPNAGGSYQGAVYLFMRTNDTAPFWHQMQLIQEPSPVPNSVFGWHVALRGEVLVVGAYGSSDFEGRVHCYTVGASGIAALGSHSVLRASDAAPGAYFGWSLALSSNGTALAIGAVRADGVRGRMYLFERIESSERLLWNESARFLDPSGHAGDRFGTAVAIVSSSSDAAAAPNASITLMSGSKHKSISGVTHNGGAFLYTRRNDGSISNAAPVNASVQPADGWETPLLLAPPAGDGALNGGAAALVHGVAIVAPYGAGCNPMPGETCAAAPDHGRVYVYGPSCSHASGECSLQQTLLPPSGDTTRDRFGASVALSEATVADSRATSSGSHGGASDRAPALLLIGSPLAFGSGRVYIYSWQSPSPPPPTTPSTSPPLEVPPSPSPTHPSFFPPAIPFSLNSTLGAQARAADASSVDTLALIGASAAGAAVLLGVVALAIRRCMWPGAHGRAQSQQTEDDSRRATPKTTVVGIRAQVDSKQDAQARGELVLDTARRSAYV